MPMPLSAIPSFEERNRCSINVHQIENSKLKCVYYSKNRKRRHKIDLRIFNNQNSHYCLNKSFSNLFHFLTRSRMKDDKGPKSRFCWNCLQPIIRKNFKKHVSFSESNAALEIRLPLESSTIEFVNWEKIQKCPFVVYADLEAINVASAQFLKLNVGQEKLKGGMQPALEQSWLILEFSETLLISPWGFGKNWMFTTTVDLIQTLTSLCSMWFSFQRVELLNKVSTGDWTVLQSCWICCLIGYFGVTVKNSCSDV